MISNLVSWTKQPLHHEPLHSTTTLHIFVREIWTVYGLLVILSKSSRVIFETAYKNQFVFLKTQGTKPGPPHLQGSGTGIKIIVGVSCFCRYLFHMPFTTLGISELFIEIPKDHDNNYTWTQSWCITWLLLCLNLSSLQRARIDVPRNQLTGKSRENSKHVTLTEILDIVFYRNTIAPQSAEIPNPSQFGPWLWSPHLLWDLPE